MAASQSPGRRPTSSHLHTSGMDAPPKTLTTPVITPMIIMMISFGIIVIPKMDVFFGKV